MSVSAWEAIFMLLVLKIPMVYLAIVVLWAVRAEPEIGEGGEEVGVPTPVAPCGWTDWQRRRALRPGRVPIRPRGFRSPVGVRVS